MTYGDCQRLLKSEAQNDDLKSRATRPRQAHKFYLHDTVSDLTKISTSSDETYDIDSPTDVIMSYMTNLYRLNKIDNTNSNFFFNKSADNLMPSAFHNPKEKYFWN